MTKKSLPAEPALHPRPDWSRPNWQSLNGVWKFAFDPADSGLKEEWFRPSASPLPLQIVVPYCWESELSGLAKTDYKGVAWYQRKFELDAALSLASDSGATNTSFWLCFGAVDWQATVWLNGNL